MKTPKKTKLGKIDLGNLQDGIDEAIYWAANGSPQGMIALSKLTLKDFNTTVREALISSLPDDFSDAYHELQCDVTELTGKANKSQLRLKLMRSLTTDQTRLYKETHK